LREVNVMAKVFNVTLATSRIDNFGIVLGATSGIIVAENAEAAVAELSARVAEGHTVRSSVATVLSSGYLRELSEVK